MNDLDALRYPIGPFDIRQKATIDADGKPMKSSCMGNLFSTTAGPMVDDGKGGTRRSYVPVPIDGAACNGYAANGRTISVNVDGSVFINEPGDLRGGSRGLDLKRLLGQPT